MKDMLKQFIGFIGLDDSVKCYFNSFLIGMTCYVIFEFENNKSIFVNKLIKEIMYKNVEFYWFRSYEEFENNIDYLVSNTDKYIIILIG